MKVAIASADSEEVDSVVKLLAKHYVITNRDQNQQEGIFTDICTIKTQSAEIGEFLRLLEAATGINPRMAKGKDRKTIEAKRAAAYVLYEYFGLSHNKVAKLLNYKGHCSSLFHCRKLKSVKIKGAPIEVIIRRVLAYQRKKE